MSPPKVSFDFDFNRILTANLVMNHRRELRDRKEETVMNRDENEPETLELHYRVMLDFRLLARVITPEVCQESFFFNDEKWRADDPDFQENIERQRRLYKLLRHNRPLLKEYLLSVLTQEAGNLVYEGLPHAFDIKEGDDILAPLYKSMAAKDVRFFDECRELNALDANTDLIATAFTVEWLGAEMEEMNRRLVGDVKMAKVVEKTKMRLLNKMNSRR